MKRAVVWLVAAVNVAASVALVLIAPGTPSDWLALLLPLSFTAIGASVALRRPDNLEAWLLLLTGTAWVLALGTPFDGGWVLPVMLMTTQLLLRFPDGGLPSPRWRWVSIASLVLMPVLTVVVSTAGRTLNSGGPNPHYVPWLAPLTPLLALLPVLMLASVASLVVRYRGAGETQRAQIRWLAWASALVVAYYAVVLATSLLYDRQRQADINSSGWFDPGTPWWLSAAQLVALLSFLLIPATIGLAIQRYRLYDVDRVISRTAAYALVTGLLLATYVTVVTLASRLLPTSSNLAVAAATLTVAVLARPVLARTQRIVDRRFDRVRFDAARTADEFAARLRRQVDVDSMGDDLVATVDRTLQPRSLTLWRPGG